MDKKYIFNKKIAITVFAIIIVLIFMRGMAAANPQYKALIYNGQPIKILVWCGDYVSFEGEAHILFTGDIGLGTQQKAFAINLNRLSEGEIQCIELDKLINLADAELITSSGKVWPLPVDLIKLSELDNNALLRTVGGREVSLDLNVDLIPFKLSDEDIASLIFYASNDEYNLMGGVVRFTLSSARAQIITGRKENSTLVASGYINLSDGECVYFPAQYSNVHQSKPEARMYVLSETGLDTTENYLLWDVDMRAPISEFKVSDSSFELSPDGTKLAYKDNQMGKTTLYYMNLQTKENRKILDNIIYPRLAWLDGNQIVIKSVDSYSWWHFFHFYNYNVSEGSIRHKTVFSWMFSICDIEMRNVFWANSGTSLYQFATDDSYAVIQKLFGM